MLRRKTCRRWLTSSKTQKGITITQKTIASANHFFTGQGEELIEECSEYLDRRLAERTGRSAPEASSLDFSVAYQIC